MVHLDSQVVLATAGSAESVSSCNVYGLVLIQMVQLMFKLHSLLLKPSHTQTGPDSLADGSTSSHG